jgi:hypothetical protein
MSCKICYPYPRPHRWDSRYQRSGNGKSDPKEADRKRNNRSILDPNNIFHACRKSFVFQGFCCTQQITDVLYLQVYKIANHPNRTSGLIIGLIWMYSIPFQSTRLQRECSVVLVLENGKRARSQKRHKWNLMLSPCLVLKNFFKKCYSSRHIEFLDTCMEH